MDKQSKIIEQVSSLLDYYKVITGKEDLTMKEAIHLNHEFKKLIESKK